MRLGDLLDECKVKVLLDGRTKTEVIREMVDLVIPEASEAVRVKTLACVMEREQLESTGLGHGVAFPHGTSQSGGPLLLGLGITRHPVDFESFDGDPVRIVFLLVGSEDNRRAQLKALARASGLLYQQAVREALLEAKSAAEVLKVIREAERPLG